MVVEASAAESGSGPAGDLFVNQKIRPPARPSRAEPRSGMRMGRAAGAVPLHLPPGARYVRPTAAVRSAAPTPDALAGPRWQRFLSWRPSRRRTDSTRVKGRCRSCLPSRCRRHIRRIDKAVPSAPSTANRRRFEPALAIGKAVVASFCLLSHDPQCGASGLRSPADGFTPARGLDNRAGPPRIRQVLDGVPGIRLDDLGSQPVTDAVARRSRSTPLPAWSSNTQRNHIIA